MIIVMYYALNFYYLASNKSVSKMVVIHYISEMYLFVVAQNVGYLKRFAGL